MSTSGNETARHRSPGEQHEAQASAASLAGTWFISDLHLHTDAPEVAAAAWHFFADLSDQATEYPGSIPALYLLGDLFEAWIGDDDQHPLSMEFATYCAHLATLGVKIYIQHGNRDFLIGKTFLQQCRATLLPETHVTKIADQATLLMHGDALCTDDTDYQRLRLQLRSKQWQSNFLAQDITLRKIQAEKYRAESKAAQAEKADNIMDVNDQTTLQTMQLNKVTRLIHGHTHRPAIHRYAATEKAPFRFRCVLGDWTDHAYALHQQKDQIVLKKWPITASVRNAEHVDHQPLR